ncbi:MAG: type II toxin-antitoxin system VapC family toxin [Vitreimonas sp.]
MRAVDTNVIVRYLTGDHPQQYARARSLVDSVPVFVATTVLLETEWVLRTAYGFTPEAMARALRGFAGLPTVTVQAPKQLKKALDWLEAGMDMADALHLAAAEGCESFVSFDRDLAKVANDVADIAVRAP